MPAQLTEAIVSFIASIRDVEIPEHAFKIVRDGFTDCYAVMVAGLDELATRAAARVVDAEASKPESRIALTAARAAAPGAAMVGAVAAHALDYDDWAFSCHPSAVLVPAIVAEAEAISATGHDMVLAYIAGFEVWGRLMAREPDHHYAKGWHPTGAFGPIGVAAAIAVLHRFDPDTIRHAVGIAASHGGGVMANFGTMTKPYHGGKSAQAGIAAARLAAAGMDASGNAIDGPNGILFAVSPEGHVDLETPLDDLGVSWTIATNGLNVKRYPTVGASQRCADAALQIYADHAPDVSHIRRVRPRVSPRHAEVMPYHQPRTGLEAKFSLEATVALGLIHGRVGIAELTDAAVNAADVQALIAKTEMIETADDDPEFANGARADFIEVELDDGTVLVSDEVTRHRGHGRNPMSTDELWHKFAGCVAGRMDGERARAAFDTMQKVDSLASASEIPTIAEKI